VAELHELTLLEQAAAVRRGELSAVELVDHYLRRIEAHDRALGAFVTVTPERAREQARAADQLTLTDPDRCGPLHGVPVAIKDLTLTAGVRTTFGSAVFAGFVPPEDADVVAALRAAGTISLGKTNTSEFGTSLYCETALGPPTRNPWDPTKTAGGSSGGAAAAVAAGLVAAAQGNDGGGSVRIPAAICGLVGLKPSRGAVPTGPLGWGGFGLPTDGPLARTVSDAAAMLDAMAVPMRGEPFLRPPPPAGGYLAAVRRGDTARRRIGVWRSPVLSGAALDRSCEAAVTEAANQLRTAGHEVVEVAAPVGPDATPLFEIVWRALALATPVPPADEQRLLPVTRWLRERGRELGVAELLSALAGLQARVRRAARRLADVDLLLSPTLATPQAPVGWFTQAGDPAEDFARQKRFSPYCAVYNVTGQPAVSLPLGATADGAPVGVMLAAAPGADGLLLQVAAELEQAAPWSHRHPPPWAGVGSATVNDS
jgi:amidase